MPTIPEQRLWQQVLLAVLADLQSPNTTLKNYRDQEFARRWVGRYPSRDFQMVCEMAGLEIGPTHRRFRQLCEKDAARALPAVPIGMSGRKALAAGRYARSG